MIFINGKTTENIETKNSNNFETVKFSKDTFGLIIEGVLFTFINKSQYDFLNLLISTGEINNFNSCEILDEFLNLQLIEAKDENYENKVNKCNN